MRLVVAVVSALAGFGIVYALFGRDTPPEPARVSVSETPAKPSGEPGKLPEGPGRNGLSTGEMANFVFKKAPEPLPEVSFVNASGETMTLASFKGRVVLLNLWATWCAPCRKEMPGLDTLQRELGSKDFEVVALSVDRAGAAASQKFLDQIKAQSLKLYVDSSARAGTILRVPGLPSTLLLDREGREIGRLVGPAHWESEEGRRLVRAALSASQ
jgi:thiol-disulfide isomerase/thioredoxin